MQYKFRVYDEHEQTFLEKFTIIFWCWGVSTIITDDWQNYELEETNRFIVYQSTGFKDRNGEDIFIGDIIHSDWFYNEYYKVCFIEGSIVWVANNEKIENSLFHLSDIVGNIHHLPDNFVKQRTLWYFNYNS